MQRIRGRLFHLLCKEQHKHQTNNNKRTTTNEQQQTNDNKRTTKNDRQQGTTINERQQTNDNKRTLNVGVFRKAS